MAGCCCLSDLPDCFLELNNDDPTVEIPQFDSENATYYTSGLVAFMLLPGIAFWSLLRNGSYTSPRTHKRCNKTARFRAVAMMARFFQSRHARPAAGPSASSTFSSHAAVTCSSCASMSPLSQFTAFNPAHIRCPDRQLFPQRRQSSWATSGH